MVSGCVDTRRGRLFAFIGLVSVAAVTLVATISPAEAARKKRRQVSGGYAPPYAAMVVDAKSGRTLHAVNEDAPRIPASITKVMTLYLLFEQIERGRFRMDSPLRVSAYAAGQAPSKIGLRPGATISVENAILALITKSANDVAVTVAENVAGSESDFARQMTARARSLGMSRTTFHNPHGLPHNPPNLTTARDLTVLARAIEERFPRYYRMFSTRSFNFAGQSYRNHNKLLGRVEGVDGIKTGYTRASGFNLMTSAKADGRHIVSVVLGGRSGASRDQTMATLVAAHLPRAATGGRSAPMIAESRPVAPEPPQRPAAAEPAVVAAAATAPVPVPRPRAEEDAPVPATARAYAAPTTTPVAPPRPVIAAGAGQPLRLSGMRPVASSTTTPAAMRWSIGQPAADGKVLRPPANVDVTSSIAKVAEPGEEKVRVAHAAAAPAKIEERLPAPAAAPARAAAPAPEARPTARSAAARPTPASKWVIQLGATDDEAKAREILARAKAKVSGSLAEASPFTEKVETRGTTLYRARFAGFDDSKGAERACAQLKRGGFSCFAVRG